MPLADRETFDLEQRGKVRLVCKNRKADTSHQRLVTSGACPIRKTRWTQRWRPRFPTRTMLSNL